MTEPAKQEIVIWDINKIFPYAKNAKKHPQEQIERLARSILRLGVTPLEIKPSGEIIKGHGRRLALLYLGRTGVPLIVRNDLTDAEADALRIADNAAVSNEIDYDLLGEETVRLSEEGFEMTDLGLTAAEIKALTTDIGELDISAFTDDIGAAVEEQKTANKKSEEEVDEKEGPVGEALGFKKVTTEQSRVIRGFMAKIEAETGLAGAAALVAHIAA